MANATIKIDSEDVVSVTKLKNSATFPLWHFEIKILFRAEQLMEIIDGSNTLAMCGSDSEKQTKWKTRDATAQHVILKTIDREVKLHLMTSENAKEMYDTLVRIYKKETDIKKNANYFKNSITTSTTHQRKFN